MSWCSVSWISERSAHHLAPNPRWIEAEAVEPHVRKVFLKLGLRESPDDHRRIVDVLMHLRSHA